MAGHNLSQHTGPVHEDVDQGGGLNKLKSHFLFHIFFPNHHRLLTHVALLLLKQHLPVSRTSHYFCYGLLLLNTL